MVCFGRDYRVFSTITSHIEELSITVLLFRGDNMPSRWDQIHRRGLRTATAYLVSAPSQHSLGLAGLMSIGSECDGKIQ